MDYVGIETIKQAYAQDRVESGEPQRGLEIAGKPITEPIYEGLSIHPEAEPLQKSINEAFRDMSMDFVALEKEIAHCADGYESLLSNLVLRMEAVNQQIQVEADRIMDINAICGEYEQFSTVVPITASNVTGTTGWRNGLLTGKPAGEYELSPVSVKGVAGNGVDGNEHVMDAIDSRDEYMTDNDHLTKWEYSRYTADKEIAGAPVPVNVDTEEARATVQLSMDYDCRSLRISSEDDIVVEDVLASSDAGITYQSCLGKELHINDPDAKYSDPGYIYDSGVITFPSSRNIKIRLRSNGITDDTVLDNDGNAIEGVRRHRISINNIEADATRFSDGDFSTSELVAAPVDCIAVYANEYVPAHYQEGTYIQYVLTVNGKDYDVVPVNSNRAGTKVIRFSDYTASDSYVEHLKETVKSASLKVIIKATQDGCTPYISNLKVCLGKAVT